MSSSNDDGKAMIMAQTPTATITLRLPEHAIHEAELLATKFNLKFEDTFSRSRVLRAATLKGLKSLRSKRAKS